MLHQPLVFVVALLASSFVLHSHCVLSETLDTEYDYGDPSISYDALNEDVVFDYEDPTRKVQPLTDGKLLSLQEPSVLPLCCEKGKVFDQTECIFPPSNFDWRPHLDGAPHEAILGYSGFPVCEMKPDFIQTYQKEVTFNPDNGKALLPYYVRLRPLDKNAYCVVKVYEPSDSSCEEFQTKIFSCYTEKKMASEKILWTSVAFSHLFLLLTLFAFFFVSELRCLQGQYMICFLISLLIYNICLFPGSEVPMDISDVSCIALGAVKYFFFCGVFLWFNTICFDIWRTLKNKQDISGRLRFLIYSAYSWVIGAVLTTAVLVSPYINDAGDYSRDDPLKDSDYHLCKLKVDMNFILQIAQLLSLVLDLIFLIMASCCVCSYSKFGNGLPRCEASLCLKQGWKLFIIMIAHTVNCIDNDLIGFPIPLWLYVLLESTAIFGIFAYRRTILKKMVHKRICHSSCLGKDERGSVQEKGHLTVA